MMLRTRLAAGAIGSRIVTHDFTRFREHAPPQARDGARLLHGGAGYNLATWQASYLGVQELDLGPWLAVPPGNEGRTERGARQGDLCPDGAVS
jgi:hypothetical protein